MESASPKSNCPLIPYVGNILHFVLYLGSYYLQLCLYGFFVPKHLFTFTQYVHTMPLS